MNRKHALFLKLIVAALILAAQPERTALSLTADKDEVLDHVLMGQSFANKRDYEKAIPEFKEAILIDPKCAAAYHDLGKAYEDQGDLDQAIICYTDSIKANPKYVLAYYFRGLLYQKKGDIDGAISDYSAMIKADPSIADAYNNRALAFDMKGDYDAAINDYSKAIVLDPGLLNVYFNRALSYMNKGQYNMALTDFNKEMEINPQSYGARHYARAITHYYKREYDNTWFEVEVLQDSKYRVASVFLKELKKASGMGQEE